MVTKEEFLNGRMANLGGLLPLTNTPPAYGVVKPVPSPDLILERIRALMKPSHHAPLRRASFLPNET